ncbi:MAG: DUF1016 N-terminal domain-containing protein [Thermodesulfobacteriota bacterium]|nr:DUF1016 N-terminal domain-containing protein [Thermodesulfobacteriota bacterium]
MTGNLSATFNEANYVQLLNQVKSRIRQARVRAGLAANKELIALYWAVGKLIVKRQRSKGWGSAVIERPSRDIRKEFPDIQGFSPRNICRSLRQILMVNICPRGTILIVATGCRHDSLRMSACVCGEK